MITPADELPAGQRVDPGYGNAPGCNRKRLERQLEANYRVFVSLLGRAQKSFSCGRYETAAVYAEMCAYCATWRHAGLFASPKLENLLLAIGRQLVGSGCTREIANPPEPRGTKILHIATWVGGLQGLNRLLWRWIQTDRARMHSVAVTGHGLDNVPQRLTDAVLNSKGAIHALDESVGDLSVRATRLRALAASADMVVLHLQTEDVLPLIALADRTGIGPVLLVNNADHNFWLGVSVSDVIVNLRESGRQLSIGRRGKAARQNALLPIVLDPWVRTKQRDEGKRDLGLAPDSILLLSVARAPKYHPFAGMSYAESHLPVLMRHKDAVLWVIGPGSDPDWRTAAERTGGRVKALGPRADTTRFYEAADIYVDSYPVVSITSLLEAGSIGLPLLSRYPYSETCQILGADTPALAKCLVRAKTLAEYQAWICKFIEKQELREEFGARAKAAVQEDHYPEKWLPALEAVYAQAFDAAVYAQTFDAARTREAQTLPEYCHRDEPDVHIPDVYKLKPLGQLLLRFLDRFPVSERAQLLFEFAPGLPYWYGHHVAGQAYRFLRKRAASD